MAEIWLLYFGAVIEFHRRVWMDADALCDSCDALHQAAEDGTSKVEYSLMPHDNNHSLALMALFGEPWHAM